MLKFAINMEEEIIRQMEILQKNSGEELAELFGSFLKIEREFLELLKQAAKVNVDLENYSPVNAEKILGKPLPSWGAAGENQASQQTVCVLWMVYALVEKSAQYYRQASLNSSHPALKLFMGSLGEVKNIFRGRAAACLRMAYNDIWGEIGFAPFVLGKD